MSLLGFLNPATSLLGKVYDEAKHAGEDIVDAINPFSSNDPQEAKRTFGLIRDAGLGETSKMAGKYIATSPAFKQAPTYDYPISKLRNANIIERAERTNQERLLNALSEPKLAKVKNNLGFLPGIFNTSKYALSDMRDGEKFNLDDYYDFETNNSLTSFARNPFYSGDVDYGLSIGSGKITSKSHLGFVKYGDKILPNGYVEHSLQDTYDFNGKSLLGETGMTLQKNNLAKSYPVKAKWKTYPLGVIKVNEDNTIDQSGVEWNFLER